MKELKEAESKEFRFRNFDVNRCSNGFILTINRIQGMISEDTYVFNTLEQLSEFIKNMDK